MSAAIIDGKAFAARLNAELAAWAAALPAGTRRPGLAVVLAGDDPASAVYVRNKERTAQAVGFVSRVHRLPADVPPAALLALVAALNADPAIDGILVQLPLPAGIDARAVTDAVDPAKDVDGFHVVNAGRLASGLPGLVPCTPLGCALLLEAHADRLAGGRLAGRHAVVIGRSAIVGRPMAQLLLQRDCTVTVAHSRSTDLPAIVRLGEIVVAAAGRPELVRGAWLRPGAVVIDVGISRVPTPDGKGRLAGDVAFAEAAAVAGAITPVPGGVGPMTIACLLRNTRAAWQARQG